MIRTNYFHLPIPHGILLDGHFYTVQSPIDVRAGIKKPSVTLTDESGLEVKLARSSTTKEFTAANLSSQGKNIAESVDQFISFREKVRDGYYHISDVKTFAAEIRKILGCWYSHFMQTDELPPHISAAHEAAFDKFTSLETIDSNLAIRRDLIQLPFKSISKAERLFEIVGDQAFDWQLHESRYSEPFHLNQLLDSSFKKGALNKLQARMKAGLDKESGDSIGALENSSDFFGEALRLFMGKGNKIFYHGWDDDHPYKIMKYAPNASEKPADSISIRVEDGRIRHYIAEKDVSLVELAIVLKCMVDSVNLGNIDAKRATQKKVVHIDELTKIFPLDYDFCQMAFQDAARGSDRQFSVSVKFPQYAVVDFESPDMIYIMPQGIARLKYDFRLGKTMDFTDYDLLSTENPGQPIEYENFFNRPGVVCGIKQLRNDEAQASQMSFSSIVWENFIRLHAVLTDGLKHSSMNSRSMAKSMAKKDVTVNDRMFKAYLPRAEFEAFNDSQPKHRQLYIGDGRIR